MGAWVYLAVLIAAFCFGVHLCSIGYVATGTMLIVISCMLGLGTAALMTFLGGGANPFR